MTWSPNVLGIFDGQLSEYAERLSRSPRKLTETNIVDITSRRIATTIHNEISEISNENRKKIADCSPVPLDVRLAILDSSIVFNKFCGDFFDHPVFNKFCGDFFDHPHSIFLPAVAVAHTVFLSYIGFVYLAEPIYDAIKSSTPPESISFRCAKFLRNDPIRSFRNALAHGNWYIPPNGKEVKFWCERNPPTDKSLRESTVSQDELIYWYTLSRAVGYAAIGGILHPKSRVE